MSEIIWGQVLFILATLCSGMLLMLGYDGTRLLRWIFRFKAWMTATVDVLYWSFASLPVFCLFFYYNEGVIRWYGMLGLLAGAVLYETGISQPIRHFLSPKLHFKNKKLHFKKHKTPLEKV